ncbi:MAG: hypothetical protein M1548_02700 [Actinobacteria bacterium]|nr:hypothetical protein [Chloroflexota bacterium]MCL5291422.1 hypothetical protein [Actinomycetota bacterium]
MSDSRISTPAPCIISEGTLINKKDMTRALETFENVKYVYSVDGGIISQGEGVIVKVFSSRETSTLIVNGCIFLNVLSFDYLRFSPHKKGLTKIELIEDTKTLKLVPLEEDSKKLIRSNRELLASSQLSFDEESPAQLFEDLGDDEDD